LKLLRILGKSGSGKTTLIEALIAELKPLRVGVIKHTRHELDLPDNSKDTFRYLNSGAIASIGISPTNSEAFFCGEELNIDYALHLLEPRTDAVIIEGARRLDVPTVLLGEPPMDANIGQVLCRLPLKPELSEEILKTILTYFKPSK